MVDFRVMCTIRLDTWYVYPKTKKERERTMLAAVPFWELDNVVMSPHRATFIEGREKERISDLAEKLNAIVAGRDPRDQVDLRKGY